MAGQLASVLIDHACGHSARRQVTRWHPVKKRYETMLDPDYLREQQAPSVMQSKAQELLNDNVERCVAYWEGELCPSCYQTSLGR